jgi:hypothetical protein
LTFFEKVMYDIVGAMIGVPMIGVPMNDG